MEELLRGENSERKCFFVDYADFGQTERYEDVVGKINNKKAVDCIIAYLEKAKKYCESQGITFDDMAVTLNFGLYYEGESSEHEFDEVIKTNPIKEFYGLRIGGVAYSNAETRALAHDRRHFDPILAQGFAFIDDETEEFNLGDLCTNFVITYDDFKKELLERGYKIDEQTTDFGGFDALKDGKSLKVTIQKKKLEQINNENENAVENEILKMKKENRRFSILRRERAITTAQRARTRSGVLAGACILGAVASSLFNGIDVSQAIEQEINALSSWGALGQYFQTLGPLKTLMFTGAGLFISRYILDSRRIRRLREEQVDFESSLEDNIEGNTNVRTR